MANITFLPVTGKISIAGVKEILLNQNFQNTVIGVYNKNPEVVNYKNSNSIKDVISSTFSTPGTETPTVESVIPAVTPNEEPAVTLSPIPGGMDDLSKEPANMNFESPSLVTPNTEIPNEENSMQTIDGSVPPNLSAEPIIPGAETLPNTGISITPLEPAVTETPINVAPATEELKSFGGNPSGVNIFDMNSNGLGITESEINNPELTVEASTTSPFAVTEEKVTPAPTENISESPITQANVETTINTLNEVAKDNTELKALLAEYTTELLKSAENKIKGAEIEKNIATIVNKIAASLEKDKNVEFIDSNSGANLFNNNTLNESALGQIPDEIMPFQVADENKSMSLAA